MNKNIIKEEIIDAAMSSYIQGGKDILNSTIETIEDVYSNSYKFTKKNVIELLKCALKNIP